jgi:hypothetical protein
MEAQVGGGVRAAVALGPASMALYTLSQGA